MVDRKNSGPPGKIDEIGRSAPAFADGALFYAIHRFGA